jgi:hypothetical protein
VHPRILPPHTCTVKEMQASSFSFFRPAYILYWTRSKYSVSQKRLQCSSECLTRSRWHSSEIVAAARADFACNASAWDLGRNNFFHRLQLLHLGNRCHAEQSILSVEYNLLYSLVQRAREKSRSGTQKTLSALPPLRLFAGAASPRKNKWKKSRTIAGWLAGWHERFAQTLGLRRNSASKKVFLLLLLPAPFK